MFDAPEYASYIALCRELRLERTFDDGDIQCGPGDHPIVYCPICAHEYGEDLNPPKTEEGLFWLPRLDQWLAMLEEATEPDDRMIGAEAEYHPVYASIYFNRRWDGRVGVEIEWTWGSKRGARHEEADAPTREEAIARLWMAVTKR